MSVSTKQIKAWDRTIRSGGNIVLSGGDPDLAIVLAIIRRSHGLGVDSTDVDGLEARAVVDMALAEL